MPNSKTFDEFSSLIKKEDLVEIRRLLDSGVDVNATNKHGWTPLMLAAGSGNLPILKLLLSKGADVRAVNNFGASALAYAALEGECKAIQLLLEAGSPIDVRPHGVSLLEFAGRGGGRFKTQRHFEILQSAGAV